MVTTCCKTIGSAALLTLALICAACAADGDSGETQQLRLANVLEQEPLQHLESGSGIAAGIYTTLVGSRLVTFDVDEDLEDVTLLFAGPSSTSFSTPAGVLSLLEPAGFVPSGTQQTVSMLEDLGPSELIEDPGRSPGAFHVWLSSMVSVIRQGVSPIGGRAVSWWDIKVDGSVDSSPCGVLAAPRVGECVTLLANEQTWFLRSGLAGRFYFLPSSNVLVYLQASTGSTVEDLVAFTAPLLDGVRITEAD